VRNRIGKHFRPPAIPREDVPRIGGDSQERPQTPVGATSVLGWVLAGISWTVILLGVWWTLCVIAGLAIKYAWTL